MQLRAACLRTLRVNAGLILRNFLFVFATSGDNYIPAVL
jgi:hypothetical protein